MPIRFDIEVYGDKLISRELLRFEDRGQDASPAFEKIADGFRSQLRRRFATKGEGTWKPLAPSTIRFKARRRLDPRILRATDRLYKSLTKGKGRVPGDDQLLIITPGFMVFGTTVDYAEYHQRGRGVPMRKPFGFTEAGKRTTLRTLQHFFVHGEA